MQELRLLGDEIFIQGVLAGHDPHIMQQLHMQSRGTTKTRARTPTGPAPGHRPVLYRDFEPNEMHSSVHSGSPCPSTQTSQDTRTGEELPWFGERTSEWISKGVDTLLAV